MESTGEAVAVDPKRMVVVGLDGADPGLCKAFIKKGVMPNLAALADQGAFGALETVHASQSPVAWASFFTGCNPGRHGVFDFIVRDPATLSPALGLVREIPRPGKMPRYESYLQKRPVWEKLGEHGVASVAAFLPSTFPAAPFQGHLVAGMGIPDLRGTQGTPVIYTTDEEAAHKEDFVRVPFGPHIETFIEGPQGARVPLHLYPREGEAGVGVGEEREAFTLQEGAWSGWQRFVFTLPESGERVHATARFKLLACGRGRLRLYLSPVITDPRAPAFPVAHPPALAGELEKAAGNYKLVSFESDVYGLKEAWIDEDTWLEDMRDTFAARLAAARYLLEEKKWRFFVCDLFAVDRAQHLFWRFLDKKHPLYDGDSAYLDTVEKAYALADAQLAPLLQAARDEDTLFFLISDHGFLSYRYNLQLNTVLKELGFLRLKEEGVSRFLGDVDWARTQAYAVGFGSVYLNLEGREARGTVAPADAESVRENLLEALKRYRFEGHRPLVDALPREAVYQGPVFPLLPDVVPVLANGYRAARESILGAAPPGLPPVHENTSKWSGDHVGPHPLTENGGVVFCNQSLDLDGASLLDSAPTALAFFGVDGASGLDGKPLL